VSRPHITDAQRRARLVARQFRQVDSVVGVAESVVCLHATTQSSIYLSAWARHRTVTIDDVDAALYRDRTAIKQLAMRRTLFVFPRDALADAIGAVGQRVATNERKRLIADMTKAGGFADPAAWVAAAAGAVRGALRDGRAASATELRAELPELEASIEYAPDKSWGGTQPLGPRVLTMMGAAGEIVRGPDDSRWYLSRPQWIVMGDWLGEELPEVSAHDGHLAMIRRWLARFGPGTEDDLVWWLGSTKTAVRKALAEIDAVQVDLDGGLVGYVLPDDLDEAPAVKPSAMLLPELDPTTMGWKDRDWYLAGHRERVFDRTGNGGQTVWWDGRIVGGWKQRGDGSIATAVWADIGRTGQRAVARTADDLAAWLGEDRPKGGYPAPFMRSIE